MERKNNLELHKARVKEILLKEDFPIRLNDEDFDLEPQYEGKVSYVYKVTLINGLSLAFKLFEGEWQAREIEVYDKSLKNIRDIPKKIYSTQDALVLEWLDGYKSLKSVSEINLDKFIDWLIEKYLVSSQELSDYKQNLSEKASWVLKLPIENLLLEDSLLNSKLRKILKEKQSVIENSFLKLESHGLPTVLDHSDLELQNILVDNEGNFKVIDWANSTKMFGFFDFAQLKKLLREEDEKVYTSYRNKIVEGLSIENYDQLVDLFGLIKELQLLSYYSKNNYQENDKSVLLSNEILEDLLPKL